MSSRRLLLLSLLALAAGPVLAAKRVVIDVRSAEEFAQGHVEGAINLDHQSIGQTIAGTGVAKDDELILYCRSGRRSALAQDTLRGLGYKRVENYGSLDEARRRLAATAQ